MIIPPLEIKIPSEIQNLSTEIGRIFVPTRSPQRSTDLCGQSAESQRTANVYTQKNNSFMIYSCLLHTVMDRTALRFTRLTHKAMVSEGDTL